MVPVADSGIAMDTRDPAGSPDFDSWEFNFEMSILLLTLEAEARSPVAI